MNETDGPDGPTSHDLPQYRILGREIDGAIKAGNYLAAGALAARALRIGPEKPALLNLAGFFYQKIGETPQAVMALQRAHALAPSDANILNSLGNALKQSGDLHGALEAFSAATLAAPNHFIAHYNRGTILDHLGKTDEARAAYEAAAALKPDYPDALGALSMLAADRGEFDSALALADRVPLRGETPAIQLSQLAAVRRDDANARRLAAIAVEREGSPAAIIALAKAELGAGETDQAKARAESLLKRQTGAVERALALGVVAMAEERGGQFERAFAHFAAAKEELRREFARDYHSAGKTSYTDQVLRARGYFASLRASNWPPPQGQTSSPLASHVFIGGFPRSGTTLMGEILAGHPGVVLAPETDSIADAAIDFFAAPGGLEILVRASESELDAYRRAYWRVINASAPGAAGKVLIDQLPFHTVYLAIIARLFPDAKIVLPIRDPRDVVLSCFRNQFAMNEATYEFCTLEGTARLYAAVMDLADVYRMALPLAVLELRYEDLVADFAAATKALCAFIGIDWRPELGDFKQRAQKKFVGTVSAPQIAQGLYDGSGQWRPYAAHLAPVLPMLEPWIGRFGYSAA